MRQSMCQNKYANLVDASSSSPISRGAVTEGRHGVSLQALKQVDAAQGQARSVFDEVVAAVRPAPALTDGSTNVKK